jgi:hypothetical protein
LKETLFFSEIYTPSGNSEKKSVSFNSAVLHEEYREDMSPPFGCARGH